MSSSDSPSSSASVSASSPSSSVSPSVPSVSHNDAIKFLEEMFPTVDRSVILFTLNECDRVLERTIDSLTRLVKQAEKSSKQSKSPERKSQFSSPSPSSSTVSSSTVSSSPSPSRPSPFKPITAEELELLKAEQHLHRLALERSVNEGPIGPAKSLKALEPGRIEREKYFKALGVKLPSTLSDLNRVASANELAAAAMGPETLKKLHLDKDKEAKQFYKRTGAIPMLANSSPPRDPKKLVDEFNELTMKKRAATPSKKLEAKFQRELSEAMLLSQGLEISKQSQIGDLSLTPAEMEFIYGKQSELVGAQAIMLDGAAVIAAQEAQLEQAK
jgi:hypothetical protein